MARLMRCHFCGTLQDEPKGAKTCVRCGGELGYEAEPGPGESGSYVQVQMELDQVAAPAGRNVERHLLITLRTPDSVPKDQAAPAQTGRAPLGFHAVLDVSGSMSGEKLVNAKEAVRQALHRLHDGDVISLVTFSHEVQTVVEPAVIDQEARRVVLTALDEIRATGTTALCGGLEVGIAKALEKRMDTNLLLLLSDGQANVGETGVEEVGARAQQARQGGLIVSALGVGQDYNEALMVEIATQGGGRFYHVEHAAQIGAYLAGELGEVAALAARDAKLELAIPPGAILMPLSPAYTASQDRQTATVAIGDIPLSSELEIPIRVALPPQRAGTRVSFEGALTYRSPAGNALKTTLNRVTVRVVEETAFAVRDGAVAPVVERVLGYMRSAGVLSAARAMSKSPAEGQQARAASTAVVAEYARLLGEDRAEQELRESRESFDAMRVSPAMAKQTVSQAYARTRGTKDFGKDTS